MKNHLYHKTTAPKASLPSIKLHKHKKYYRPHHNQENALQYDLDGFIMNVTPSPQSCSHLSKHFSSQQRFTTSSGCSPCLHWEQIKQLRGEISKYMQQMGKPHSSKEGEYMQFVRLSRESQDYLQYYIRNHFKQSEPVQAIKCADQAVILSLLKNSYPCLTGNPAEIVSRILLSFSINPLNDFHLIPWTTFASFRKLAVLKQTKTQSRLFLVSYLMGGKRSIGKKEFWSMIGRVLRKLKEVISQRNVERLLDRVVSAAEWIPEEMGKEELQRLMTTYWYFIWEEIVRLIFIV